jgi:hypothetical protein
VTISSEEFDEAEALKPADVLNYVRASGWRLERELDRSQLWTFPGNDSGLSAYEVIVPVDVSVRDYANRMADLLSILSVAERRQPADVLIDLTATAVDAQYVGLRTGTPSGTAPVADVARACVSVRDMLVSAATAVLTRQPQVVQPARKPRGAQNFVKRARMGPTRPGSYVLCIQVPLPDMEEHDGVAPLFADFGPEPFERQVSRLLYRAIRGAYQAADSVVHGSSIRTFEQYAASGLSANMCEAIAGLGGDQQNEVAFRFTWAQSQPIQEPTPPLVFGSPHIGILESAAKDLRSRNDQRDVTMRGTIIRLHRETRSGPGDITVSGYVEGEIRDRARKVRIHLFEDDYSRAGVAHDDGNEVIVRGDLIRRGTVTYVEPVREFRIQDTD